MSTGFSPAKYPRLFAVVNRTPAAAEPPTTKHRDREELRHAKLAELKTKKAIDRVNDVMDRLEKRIAEYDRQIEYLQRRRQVASERLEHISDRALEKLDGAGLTRADGFHRSFSTQPCPAAVNVTDAKAIPAEFMRQPKTPDKAPDRVKIKKALEAGTEVPGCTLVQGTSLRRT